MGRPFAVAIHRRGVLIGYLPKPDARPVAKLLDRGGRARAFVLALRHERSLTGSRLKSITVEIEAANPDDAPWSDADRAEIAALGVEAPLTRRRTSLAVPGRIAGVLCAGVVAMAAWANIPQFAPETQGGESAAMIVAADPPAVVEPASKNQERPATVANVASEMNTLPLMANAALTLPTRFTPFDANRAPDIVVAVRNFAAPAAPVADPVVPVSAAPMMAAPDEDAAAADVPLPLPRPDVRPGRSRR